MTTTFDQTRELKRIIAAYDSPLVRSYCFFRFKIISPNILHILGLCLREKRTVLDIGCGFGLFDCYLAIRYPHIRYCGCDVNPARIDFANRAAAALGLANVNFVCQDARGLRLEQKFDAIVMIDLLHHLNDSAKVAVLETCQRYLLPRGRLVIKDIATRPVHKLAFTWLLDALVTFGFDMWYWSENDFREALDRYGWAMETFSIRHWIPYAHVAYLCERPGETRKDVTGFVEGGRIG